MRFSLHVGIASEHPGLLPLDYRQGFASFLKAVLKRYNPSVFRLFYQSKVKKPFCFSVYFPRLDRNHPIEKGPNAETSYLRAGSQAWWNFSFADERIGVEVLNAFVRWGQARRSHAWRKQWEFSLQRLRVHPPAPPFAQEEGIFRTLSPFLVKDPQAPHRYLTPQDEVFEAALQFLVGELSQSFLGQRLVLEWSRCDFSALRPQVVWHYGQYMTGSEGVLRLAGPPALLQLLYQAGIGVRRSQGFGFLEKGTAL
ncbi:MAG: CRISPR-associated endoribonuclease Cas6 [Bacteroidia bacterium]|nr:MAG: CRISPR-associated endoribonuclease Cas6 [Bacteroidia bacterium]